MDDALARMARWEELRRRAAEGPPSPGTAVEEVVRAARRAVERDHDLAVTVTVGYRGRTSAVRVEHQDGAVTVTVAADEPEHAGDVEPTPPPAPSAAFRLAELLRQADSG